MLYYIIYYYVISILLCLFCIICFIIVQILYIEINNIGCSEIVITTISILTYDRPAPNYSET